MADEETTQPQAPASGSTAPTQASSCNGSQAASTQAASTIALAGQASSTEAPTGPTPTRSAQWAVAAPPATTPTTPNATAQAAPPAASTKAASSKKTPESNEPTLLGLSAEKPKSTSKHAPITDRGAVILQKDNENFPKKAFKKGRVEWGMLEFRIKDTTGKEYTVKFSGKDSMNWDDAKHISEANKWRNQVLRRFFKNDDTVQGRTPRAKWSSREVKSLQWDLKRKIAEVGKHKLTSSEWIAIAEAHNKKYQGKTVSKAERLVNDDLAKKTETISKRSASAMKALFTRNPELKAFLADLTGPDTAGVTGAGADDAGDGSDLSGGEYEIVVDTDDDDDDNVVVVEEEETDSEESPSKKKRKVEHGGVLDPRLEDPSDDEDEGQRPASNPTGAVLVSAS